jgi:hypothetical protein
MLQFPARNPRHKPLARTCTVARLSLAFLVTRAGGRVRLAVAGDAFFSRKHILFMKCMQRH